MNPLPLAAYGLSDGAVALIRAWLDVYCDGMNAANRRAK